MTEKLHNVVIVGTGNIVQSMYVPTLQKLGVSVVQCIDTNDTALTYMKKKFPHAVIANSLDSIDASATCALVASPAMLHIQHVDQLLKKGLHVLCEKPLALTHHDATSLLALATERSLVLQVGYYRRFHDALQFLRSAIRANTYGNVLRCVVTAGHQTGNALPASIMNPSLNGGGVLADFGVHVFDTLLALFNEITVEHYADDSKGGIEANAFVQAVATQKSIPITCLFSRTNDIGYSVTIQCENTTLRYEMDTGFAVELLPTAYDATSYDFSTIAQLTAPQTPHYYFAKQWQSFTNAMEGKPSAIPSIQDAVTTTELLETCYAIRQPLHFTWEEGIPKVKNIA